MQTSDANHGHQTLVERVEARREELRQALEDPRASRSTREDIESALAAVELMLTGDVEHLPDVVRRDLTGWLELHKYLGLRADAAPAPKAEPPTPLEIFDDLQRSGPIAMPAQ